MKMQILLGREGRRRVVVLREGEDFGFCGVHKNTFARTVGLDGAEDKGKVLIREKGVGIIKVSLES